jgi:hypothetical protein
MASANLTLLGTNRLPAAPCFIELAISTSKDLFVSFAYLIHRSYVANFIVEPHLIVVSNIAVNKAN